MLGAGGGLKSKKQIALHTFYIDTNSIVNTKNHNKAQLLEDEIQ